MLTTLQIKNFKGWRDTGRVQLAPLTVIFGANSAGKSSLGHLLLALKQTVLSTDRKRALHLGDKKSLIDLGTFADCIHGHDLKSPLQFDLAWTLPQRIHIKDPLEPNRFYAGDQLSLKVAMLADAAGQPQISRFEYSLTKEGKETLDATFSRDAAGKIELTSRTVAFKKAVGRKWPLEDAEKFYRLSETSRARFQNADFLLDFALEAERMLESLCYLGPLRDYPERTYAWSGNTPDDVGMKGQDTIAAILAADAAERKLNRIRKAERRGFSVFIAERLKQLGVIESFQVRAVAQGRKEYEVLLKTQSQAAEVKLTDVGIGVSQVLPAVVLPFYCPAHSIVWMEQPEIHLHPQVQAELADVFITAIQARENGAARKVQLVIESHSEHFLNRLQRRVAEGVIAPEDVAVHFCSRSETATEIKPLRVDIFGDIENWPPHFFGDEMADLTARTVAAAAKQSKQAASK